MSTLAARRVDRANRGARLAAENRCKCGRPMDREGERCQRCTGTKRLLARQRNRQTYGAGWTVGLIHFNQAQAQRGMA